MESLIPCLTGVGFFLSVVDDAILTMQTNPFESTGNKILIDWFDAVVTTPPGIHVVGGLSGMTVWATKQRCLEGLKRLGLTAVALRGADQRLVGEALSHAAAGSIVLLALKIDEPAKARGRLDELGLGDGWGLVRSVLFQKLANVAGGKTEIQVSWTAISHA